MAMGSVLPILLHFLPAIRHGRRYHSCAFHQPCTHCIASHLMSTIQDIEKDLLYQTTGVISRIMQKLLYSLSYDRKVSYVVSSHLVPIHI